VACARRPIRLFHLGMPQLRNDVPEAPPRLETTTAVDLKHSAAGRLPRVRRADARCPRGVTEARVREPVTPPLPDEFCRMRNMNSASTFNPCRGVTWLDKRPDSADRHWRGLLPPERGRADFETRQQEWRGYPSPPRRGAYAAVQSPRRLHIRVSRSVLPARRRPSRRERRPLRRNSYRTASDFAGMSEPRHL
jgi:hypothetical protein